MGKTQDSTVNDPSESFEKALNALLGAAESDEACDLDVAEAETSLRAAHAREVAAARETGYLSIAKSVHGLLTDAGVKVPELYDVAGTIGALDGLIAAVMRESRTEEARTILAILKCTTWVPEEGIRRLEERARAGGEKETKP